MLGMLSMHRSMSQSFDRHILDGLGVLRAVVEAGSFVGAGEILGITQPAVSRAIAKLEKRTSIRMFQRTARSIRLTDDGRTFYETVAPHLTAIADATTRAGATRGQVSGRLRVNIDPSTAQIVVAPRIAPFLERHPELFVDLVVRDRLGDLVRDGFDLAVRVGTPKPSSLKARLLMRTRILTCASASYLAIHGTPRKPKDIERHTCILMRDPTTGSHFAWEFVRGRNIVPVDVHGSLMVNQFGAMLAACAAGQGIAQLLELHARALIEDGTLVQVLADWADETYPLYAYYHATAHVPAKVRAFLDFVTEACASDTR